MKLTAKQKEMYDRLKREGKIKWVDVRPAETRVLNALVHKGYAEVVSGSLCPIEYWVPRY